LGKCHCEGDEDDKAIVCLEQSVERDPYCLDALLTLGVSYVNEMDLDRALKNLKAWVVNNPIFCGLDIESAAVDPTANKLQEVENLFKEALTFAPGDPDVLECLGVCYNVSRNYNEAVDCLEKALQMRPDDYTLMNKLGATLANSNRSEEALPHYIRALKIKSKFSRGWLNMAIAHR